VEIKERIVKGAQELFFRYGIKSITMDDVAKHLAISKKTIYQFLNDKHELVSMVTKVHLEEQERIIIEIADRAIDPIDEVLKLSEHLRQLFQNINSSLLFEVQKYHPKAWQIFLNHREFCIHNSLAKNLKSGIEKGLYRKEIDVEIMSKLRMEEILMGFNPFIFPQQKFNLQNVQIQLIDHFLHGICTLKGHKLINKYKQISEED
jgi:TetR/AcrR family transcriptional regulator, cholesterol catabolism regulator